MPYRKGLALATIAVASAVLFVNAACAPSDPSRSNPTSSAREAPLPGVPAGASTKDIYDAMMVAAKARGLNLQPDEVLVVADSEQSPSFVFTIVADLPTLDRATVLNGTTPVLFAYIPGVKSQVDVPPGFYRVTFDERRSVAHLADDNRRVVGDLSLEVTDATDAGQGGVQVIARFPRPGLGDDCGALCYDRCFPVEVGGGTVPPIPPPTSASPFPTAPPVTGLRSSVVDPSDTVDPYKIISKSCIDVIREAELAGI